MSEPQRPETQPTTADLIARATDDVRRLVHDEMQLAQAELAAKARQSAKGAAMLGAASVLGAMAAGTSAAFVVRLFEKLLPPGTAALFATGALGGGAAALARAGIEELRTINPVPEQTVASVRSDVRAAGEAATG